MKRNELLRKALSVSVMICMTVTAWSAAFAEKITVCPEESPLTTISASDTGTEQESRKAFKDSKPKITTSSCAYNKIKLSWNTLSGADGYVIYRAASKSGKYKQIAVLSGAEKTTYRNGNLKTAKAYYYKVRAYQTQNDKKIFSKYSAVKSASARPAKVKGLTVTYEQGDVVLKWKKQSGASGYQLQVRENGRKWKAYIEDGTYQFYPEKYAKNYRYDPNQRYFMETAARWIIDRDKSYAYDKEAIQQKLIENQSKQRLGMRSLQVRTKRKCLQELKKPKRRISGLRGRYLHYCYRLGAFQKRQSPGRVHYLYRDDLLKLNNITAEARLLCETKIESAEELFAYEKKLESEVKELCIERKKRYNENRRAGFSAEKKECIAKEREALTEAIRSCRRKLHLCKNIMDRSEHLKETMEQEMREKMKTKKRETERGQGR